MPKQFVTLVALVAAAACDRAGATQVHPAQARIVCVGGQVTEIVYAIGAGADVVGVDTSSTYPRGVERLPTVGYQRTVSAEGVIALRPTLVLVSADAGPPAALVQIRSTGIRVVTISADRTVDGAKASVRAVGAALERTGRAERLVAQMELDLQRAAEATLQPHAAAPPRVLFVYARGSHLVMAAGTDTGPDEIIRLAGAVNAVHDYAGYRPLTAEGVANARPDAIVVPSRGLASLGGIDSVLSLPGIALTPAGQNRRVVAMDDQLLLAFGPRLGVAVAQLAQALR